MSTISAVKSWASNEVLTASDLNAEFSNLISAVNNLNSDNLDLTANYTFTGNLQGANVTAATALLPDASGGADIGSTSLEFGDVFLADGKAIKFGSDQDITVTHVADTGLTMAGAHANGTNLQLNNTATDGDAVIQFALSGTVAYSLGVEDGDSDKFVINYGTGALGAQPALEIDSSGNTSLAGTLDTSGAATLASLVCTAGATFGGGTGSSGATITTAGAGTFDGIIKTEDTTEATSTTDGSLQTDGGLSVAKDAIIGDDLKLLSDSAVLSLGADSDATLTHDGTTGVTIAANPITFDSGAALTLDAHTGVFVFKDAGSEVLRFTEGNSGDVTIKLATDGKDLVFTDNGDATGLKVLDAAAGINVPGEVQTTKIAYTDGDDAITIADGGGVTTASTLTIGSVAAAGTDTDKFLVLDSSGNVDYRTGAQVASDIGAITSVSATAADDIATGDGAVNIVTTSGNITLDAQANDADLIFKVDDGGSAVTALTLDGSDEGNAIFVNDVQLKSDSAVLEFGADLDTTLTHTDGTGLTLNSTNKLTFGDAASFIQQSSDGTLRIDGEAIIDLNASTRVDVSGDLKVGGEVQTANIGYTDGDNAITIADGGGCTFAQDATFGDNTKVTLGTGGDVDISYDGTNTLFENVVGSGIFHFQLDDGSTQSMAFPGVLVNNTSATDDNVALSLQSGTAGKAYIFFGDSGDDAAAQMWYDNNTNDLEINAGEAASQIILKTASNERMRIDADGAIGIGGTPNSNVNYKPNAQILGTSVTDANLLIGRYSNDNGGGQLTFLKTRSTSIGTTGDVSGNTGVDDNDQLGQITWYADDQTDSIHPAAQIRAQATATASNNNLPAELIFSTTGTSATGPTDRMTIDSSGNVSISGALSKGSGSFRIDHPLESKKDTHELIHSFIEGPQADLIYRGTATLSSGTAEVNLDTAARMTDGTFVKLNGNVQAFTSNESGWEAVRGSVTGNVLTIDSNENTSTATVSWMVIGERKDQHMIDTDWTDSEGRVITEPEKPVVEEVAEDGAEDGEEETAEEA